MKIAQHFEIPRDIFSGPGDSPNFFSLGFAVFFATPGEVFPGLDRQGLLRPPAITPPIVSNRSGEVFAELLHMLRGYPIHIRNEEHRAELLRDCRYFHLRGLEQKLLPHHISYNVERQRSEIVIRLEDIRPSGIQVAIDSSAPIQPATPGWWVQYARPFVDDDHYELIVEIGGESTQVDLESQRANFHGSTKSRMSSLLQVITNKTNLSTRGSQGLLAKNENISRSTTPGSGSLNSSSVRVQLDPEADIVLDGDRYESRWNEIASAVALDASAEESSWILNSTRDIAHEGFQSPGGIVAAGANSAFLNPPQSAGNLAGPSRKRKRSDSVERLREWIVRKGHWRLQVQRSSDVALGGLEVVLVALKLDAFTRQHSRNMQRGFLDAQ
ncbi:bifunctional glutathione transferase/peroxidase [Emydomyces testavorans]|uniref:Bifunctional glutathione transferase/peroxidase n=1 Tax=Emydomyces testavorans TaxID=2070801 RepID=A0AAF0IHA2_9EURO|nr:bifunctional glutathione transferase/peroxidase [Emydomyces testavorans]